MSIRSESQLINLRANIVSNHTETSETGEKKERRYFGARLGELSRRQLETPGSGSRRAARGRETRAQTIWNPAMDEECGRSATRTTELVVQAVSNCLLPNLHRAGGGSVGFLLWVGVSFMLHCHNA